MNTYFTGFAIEIEAILSVGGKQLTQAELSALTITAAMVTPGRELAQGSTVVSCTVTSSNRVRASWTAAQSAAIAPGRYLIEFRTSDGPFCHEGQPIALIPGVAA